MLADGYLLVQVVINKNTLNYYFQSRWTFLISEHHTHVNAEVSASLWEKM